MKTLKFLIFVMLIGITSQVSSQTFGGGTGISSDPYIISSVTHLLSMQTADYTNPVYFKMTADVDMTGQNWTQLNTTTKIIYFEGNGHLISNLTINSTSSYASLFGVLWGSCKNLGVVNATINSTAAGSGIIAGYCGSKAPALAANTGMIENCYTSGTVTGTDAVGGIAGNIGKPYNTNVAFSGIKNCYSTANVISTLTTSSSRVGGIVGINYAGGKLINCYATGMVTSNGSKAGGIAGWSDTDIVGCVALNDFIINKISGNIGRISANMGIVGGVIAQGTNCWGAEGVVLNNGGTILTPSVMGTVTTSNGIYDGETKSQLFLGDYNNFESILGWNFSGINNIWAHSKNYTYPILQWQYQSFTTNLQSLPKSYYKIFVDNGIVFVTSEIKMQEIVICDASGKLVQRKILDSSNASFDLKKSGIYIVSIIIDGNRVIRKIVI